MQPSRLVSVWRRACLRGIASKSEDLPASGLVIDVLRQAAVGGTDGRAPPAHSVPSVCAHLLQRIHRLGRQFDFSGGEILAQVRDGRGAGDRQEVW